MQISLKNDFLEAVFNTSGAELCSLKDHNREYIWQADPKFWGRHAPVLFPFVGKLRKDSYRLAGKTYRMPQHGFARDSEFEIKEQDENSVCFLLKSSEETLAVFPFDFELEITYTMVEKQLDTVYSVKNTGEKKMLFSIGGHPAFALDTKPDGSREDYILEFEYSENCERLLMNGPHFTGKKAAYLEGGKIDLNASELGDNTLVFNTLESDFVVLKTKKGKPVLQFNFPKFPNFAIWSANRDAPFICLEPWYGLADFTDADGNLKHKAGMLILPAGSTFLSVYSIGILD